MTARTLSGSVVEFVHQLREAAIPVSMAETLDAIKALQHVDALDRAQFKAVLGATLIKRTDHWPSYETLFDVFFAPRRPRQEAAREPPRPGTAPAETGDSDAPPMERPPDAGEGSTELLESLLDALREGDLDALRDVATEAVSEHSGVQRQRQASQRYYMYRVLSRLDLSEVLQKAAREEREAAGERTELDDRLAREEIAQRLEHFRRMLAEEIRYALTGHVRDAEQVEEHPGTTPIEDVDFLGASPTELREMQHAIKPLARRLATRVAQRRRTRHHGRLDVRRTVRRSLSAGGVPLDPAFRRPRVSRPALYLLCDVSGSVAEFAKFTMALLQAMRDEFTRTRLFAFVDGIDEVTTLFEQSATPLDARHLLYRANVVWEDGHSDYGSVFNRFWERYGGASLDPRTTLIITGDARNNYRDPGLKALRLIRGAVKSVYWLNPEERSGWDSDDSVAGAYEPHVDGMFETRNLRQLADFVYGLV